MRKERTELEKIVKQDMNDKITKIQKGIQLANIEIIKLREENTGILKKNAIFERFGSWQVHDQNFKF